VATTDTDEGGGTPRGQEAIGVGLSQTHESSGRSQLAAAVRASFESLGRVERGALELAHNGGLTVRGIAEVLGEEPGAVRLALRHALSQLSAVGREDAGPA
jgi:DNA-directed RNA polymerase specialized sigma24 family protein